MLITKMTGNEPDAIYLCLRYLMNCTSEQRKQRRVSVIFGTGKSQVSIGDDLEIADLYTRKLRKKRWWEKQQNNRQLKLPFLLFDPAEILSITRNRCEDVYALRLCCENHTLLTSFQSIDWPLETSFGLKAIRIHKVANQSEDKIHCTEDSSITGCVQIAERAVCDGIIVTRCGDVYNKITGVHVGTNLTMEPELLEHTTWPAPPFVGTIRGSFCLHSGDTMAFAISSVDYIDSDYYDASQLTARRCEYNPPPRGELSAIGPVPVWEFQSEEH